MPEPITGWIFTFGQGYNLRDNFVRVNIPDEIAARDHFIAFRSHVGDVEQAELRWATCYPVPGLGDEVIEQHGLTEVPISTPITYLPGRRSEG